MYVNMMSAPEKIQVIYDPKVNVLSLYGGAKYQVGNSISVGANITVNNFYKKTDSRVWHEPGLRFNADLTYQPLQGLRVIAYAAFLDQIYALNEANKGKLAANFDMGIGAEYQLTDRLSLFLNINNLLNNKYERWYGYQAYGINVYGGLRFKF